MAGRFEVFSDEEADHMGENLMQDLMKGKENRRLALWIGDTGSSTLMCENTGGGLLPHHT